MPDEITQLQHDPSEEREHPLRQVLPPSRDALPAYVQTVGARVHKVKGRLEVKTAEGSLGHISLRDASSIYLQGPIQISAQAMRATCDAGIPVIHANRGGWVYGITQGMPHKNVMRRIAQHRASADPLATLEISKVFVEGKIHNSRIILRRNDPTPDREIQQKLKALIKRARRCTELNELRGVEGLAARHYFANFTRMIKRDDWPFAFESRNRRPPRDPVNALLSYAYGILTREFLIATLAVGFEPYLGFLHAPRYGRPSLALDLMEEFRPLVADSVVLSVINRGEIRRTHFLHRAGYCTLTGPGRKIFLEAYQRRIAQEVSHPIFKYQLTYKQLFEVQTRLLDRHLSGEIAMYPSI